ncbi:hypothetical protein [Pedobacter sp. SYSU D00535]|uniref:hypothetical protein n=1 Tax=Pedobacter sp. SYSU D00535 TaxID=2810308 RepID=UPI001A96360E|nr:hypothetical protein [Pedobacter sp. SYSU D00535]
MKTYTVNINGVPYFIEQPSSDYNIFYVNRKKGTCCIAKDANKKWIIETQVNPEAQIPVEQIGRFLEDQLSIN